MREAPGAHDPTKLPPDLPIPTDDGAARHLTDASLPNISLPATAGPAVTLSRLKGVRRVSPHRRSRGRCAAGLGRYSGRARLYAAIVRVSRSFCRAESAWRRPGLWAVHSEHGLSVRSRDAASSAVPASLRRGTEVEVCDRPADIFHVRHDPIQ